MLVLLAAPLLVDPWDLVRVDQPAWPDAETRSATGAVLLTEPPPGVRWRTEAVPVPDAVVADEAVDAVDARPWHDVGFTGAGVKVAVFDIAWFGAELDPDELGPVITHDCFSDPTCAAPMDTLRARYGFEEGVHGVACAEVIHDLAPDAELHLVRVSSLTVLENAVAWAIREGVDVVSMSMSFFNQSFYDGTGPVNALVDELDAAGVQLVTSAGNYARGHWLGAYADLDGDGRADLDGDNGLWLYASGESSVSVTLTWDDFADCGATDLDVVVRGVDGTIYGRRFDGQRRGADRCEPVERARALLPAEGWYRVEVWHGRGPTSGLPIRLMLPGSGRLLDTRREGSIADPGSSPRSLTVAAVRAGPRYAEATPAAYSSWGPTADGTPKPDVAGPDGLSTAAYGAVGFYGTSAATPSVAGALAIVLSSDPTLSPRDGAERLRGWALGGAPAWALPDPGVGAGVVRLPEPSHDTRAGCTTSLGALGWAWLLVLLTRRRR